MKSDYRFNSVKFPLDHIHHGIMAGTGGLGLFFWGQGSTIIISAGLGDFWDHRGGMPWQKEHNYKDIRRELEAKDIDAIRTRFAERVVGNAKRPTLLPFCRVEMRLPAGWKLQECTLDQFTGLVCITAKKQDKIKKITFAAANTDGRCFACSGVPAKTAIKLIPSYFLAPAMAERAIEKPETLENNDICWFCQKLPVDDSAALLIKKTRSGFSAVVKRNTDDPANIRTPDFEEIRKCSVNWWKNYWQDAPEIIFDDEQITKLYYRAFFKYGIMTDPAGPTPGLQGPWIEDDDLPPWQGDYHYNINVQMCISPGFSSGKFSHLKPAFDQLLFWKEHMAQNAKFFTGTDDGYMIAHAVDDRGTCMGGFWTGSIDHSCAAWMAHLMFRYCLYTGDKKFLKDEVMDFCQRVLNVFICMMEKDDTGRLCLPVTISPEYNGSDINAWGKNASFQLAAVHALLLDLNEGAEILGITPDPQWRKIAEDLPEFTATTGEKGQEIALWEGQDLAESHRHHSHLAGITPFGTLDFDDEKYHDLISNSDYTWTTKGTGLWAGWSFPWASQIRTRLANPEAAALMLNGWIQCFNTPSGTSLYMPKFRGITRILTIYGKHVMQMDAEMGCVSAILDMFAYHERNDIHFFRGIRKNGRYTKFSNIYLPYGLRASGSMNRNKYTVTITAAQKAETTISLPDGRRVKINLKPGESITFKG